MGRATTDTGCPSSQPRPSGASRKRAIVLLLVHAVIAAHIAHWWTTGRSVSPLEPSEAMEFSKHSVVNAGFVFFALTIGSTALLGRWFCGWACHLVALQDLCRAMLMRVGIRPRPLRSRALGVVPMLAFVYMFLWPVAYRLWIRDDFAVRGTELTTSGFWDTFPGPTVAIVTFVVCGFVCVYFLGAKGFCSYACPYGAAFGVADRFAPGRIRVTDACEQCGHCTKTCSSNVVVHDEVRQFGMVVDAGCMKCMDCVSVCPKDALYFGFGKPAGRTRREARSLAFGDELLVAAVFAASFFVFRGLYGLVPFLLALGMSGCLAYGALLAWRVARGRDAKLQQVTLSAGGQRTGAGRALVAAAAVVAALWSHSAWIRYETWRAHAAFADLAEARSAWFAERRDVDAGLVERLERHASNEVSYGLVESADAHERLAWAAVFRGDRASFDEHLREALARAPRRTRLHLLAGDALQDAGDLANAELAYRNALGLDERSAAAWIGVGTTLGRSGRANEAIDVLERGSAALPHVASLAFNTGVARLLLPDVPGAIAEFERALDIDPDHLPSRENLAGVLCSIGRLEEGAAHFERALETSPNDVETRMLLARAYVELRAFRDAERVIEAAVRIAPDRDDVRALASFVREALVAGPGDAR